MSSNLKNVIRGVKRDFKLKNSDIFGKEQSINYFNRESWSIYMRSLRRDLGVEETVFFWVASCMAGVFFGYLTLYRSVIDKPSVIDLSNNEGMHNPAKTPEMLLTRTNADIHYSRLYSCFTDSPSYGLNKLPKRPWEVFNNPEETMKRVAFKHRQE